MFISENADITSGVIGGLLIGSSATYLMYKEHKVTGISGITATALQPVKQDKNGRNASGGWTWSYIAGMLGGGTVLVLTRPEVFGDASNPLAQLSPLGAAVAGLLTGWGTSMASGCTSGHGICGLPRRSLRSLAAVCSFMFSGGVTAYVVRTYRDVLAPLFASGGCSGIFGSGGALSTTATAAQSVWPVLCLAGGALAASRVLAAHSIEDTPEQLKRAPKHTYAEPSIGTHAIAAVCGALFSTGLGVGGMLNPARVQGFLDVGSPAGWDPSLMGVMGGGVLLNLATFEWMRKSEHAANEQCPTFKFDGQGKNMLVDSKLIEGSMLFGVGWALSGVCPGPALASLPGAVLAGFSNGGAVLYVPFMMMGMALQKTL